MPVPLDPITLISNSSISKQLPNPPTILAVEVMNKSSFDIQVEGIVPSGSPWQPSGTTKWYIPGSSCSGNLIINAFNTAQLNNPPTSVALVTIYYKGDTLPDNLNVATIPTQVVQANVSTISVLQNLRQTAGTQWLLVTDANGNTVWSADNNGNLFVGQEQSGSVTTLLQLLTGNNNPIQLLGNLVNWDKLGNYNGVGANLSSNILLPNNISYQAKDSAGNIRNILTALSTNELELRPAFNDGFRFRDVNGNDIMQLATSLIKLGDNAHANFANWGGVDGSGRSFIQANSNGNAIAFYDKNGSLAALIDANHCVSIGGVSQSVNGDTSGTMTAYEVFSSSTLKIVLIIQNNYKHVGSAQFITLKTSFSNTCGVLNFGAGAVNVATGGVAASGRQVTWGTGTSSGSQATTSQCNQDSAWFPVGGTGFTQVGSSGGYTSAFNGIAIYCGL